MCFLYKLVYCFSVVGAIHWVLSKQLVINVPLQCLNFLLFVPGAFKKLLLYLNLGLVQCLLLIM